MGPVAGTLHGASAAQPPVRCRLGATARLPHASVVAIASVVSLLSLVPLGFISGSRSRRAGPGGGAGRSAPCRRAADQHRFSGSLHDPDLHVLSVTHGLAHGTLRYSRRPLWSWLAVAPLAVPAFVHSYAWISLVPGMRGLWSGVLRFGARLLSFPLSAGRRRSKKARSGDRGRGRLARPRALAGLFSCRSAAAAACHLRRFAADRAAPACRVRPLCDDPLRHVRDGDRRPVPVGV